MDRDTLRINMCQRSNSCQEHQKAGVKLTKRIFFHPVAFIVFLSFFEEHVTCFPIPRGTRALDSFEFPLLALRSVSLDQDEQSADVPSFASSLDPSTEQAHALCRDLLYLTESQYTQIRQLTTLVCEWNTKLNLVSRKDCNESTVFARHVLPSLATYTPQSSTSAFDGEVNPTTSGTKRKDHENVTADKIAVDAMRRSRRLGSFFSSPGTRVMDVGTGGGFPGLPCAIQYPATQFVLADSVGKKVASVADMARSLRLDNVETFHGRVEEYFSATTVAARPSITGEKSKMEKFDVVTGRSVTALPQFCAWIQHLLKPDTGHLIYWIGGEIEPAILQLSLDQIAVQERIPLWRDEFDKKIVVFTAAAVRKIASKSGVKVEPTKQQKNMTGESTTRAILKRPKGAWQKKNDGQKQRGYENFQRYSSTRITQNVDDNGESS